MNTIHRTLSALLAGAFLAIGFEVLSERFDPLADLKVHTVESELAALPPCTLPCSVPEQA